MKTCSGIIISPGKSKDFGPLAYTRPDYMLPFGGRYRLIDFALSNMANYNISHVVLFAGNNVRSTLDHIGNGSDWELNRRKNGLLINPMSYDEYTKHPSAIYTYHDAIPFFKSVAHENIYIEDPMILAKPDISSAYDDFLENDYDVMILYKKEMDEQGYFNGMKKLVLDEEGRFLNIGYNLGTKTEVDMGLGRIFIKTKVFIDLVEDAIENGSADTIMKAIQNHRKRLKIGTYKIDSRTSFIYDINSYYRANMKLLDPVSYRELFNEGGMVYTKAKDEPSTLYTETAKSSNSLVANGCIIEGQVENSVIFRGVHVHKNAIVRNCILNQDAVVKEDAVCVNTITDKNAVIGKGVTIAGAINNPYVVAKGQEIRNSDFI